MKFRMIDLGYRQTPDYPYGYRIELVEYDHDEREQLTAWLDKNKIPHTTAGWNTGSVIYLGKEHASWFSLRWA